MKVFVTKCAAISGRFAARSASSAEVTRWQEERSAEERAAAEQLLAEMWITVASGDRRR